MKKVSIKFRKDWNGVIPVAKIIPSKKLYNRKDKYKKRISFI